jgi:hypothetical protein
MQHNEEVKRKMFNRKGQNIAEYSILIALVIGAAVAMQVYIKRGVQGRIADATDTKPPSAQLVEGATNLLFTTNQYEPYYEQSSGEVFSNRDFTDTVGQNASVNRGNLVEETVRYSGATDNIIGVNTTTWKDSAR